MSAQAVIAPADFHAYPSQAKQLATDHLATLNRLPPIFAALLLRELIGYDWQFPAEQAQTEGQLKILGAPWTPSLAQAMEGFAGLPSPPELEDHSPATDPAAFVEQATAYLWTAHAIEAFRTAGTQYGEQLSAIDQASATVPATPRLVIVLLGQGASPTATTRLFQKLRPSGTLFTSVNSDGCLAQALDHVRARAKQSRRAYGHWYIDGGAIAQAEQNRMLTTVSYAGTAPMRNALLDKVHAARITGTVGPEDLRSMLTRLTPEQFGPGDGTIDPVIRHFELRLLTEGSGTQIYSTSFVQWAAREALRRARPETLLVRYAPRQAERSMNELLLASTGTERVDPEGSLADADMGAYYTWLNLQRLAHPETNRFVTVFEGGTQALAIAPSLARHSVSTQPCDLERILHWTA